MDTPSPIELYYRIVDSNSGVVYDLLNKKDLSLRLNDDELLMLSTGILKVYTREGLFRKKDEYCFMASKNQLSEIRGLTAKEDASTRYVRYEWARM